MSTGLTTPPVAPGALTRPPSINELRAYLEAFDTWRVALDRDLDALDRRARSSRTPDTYSNDVSLAMALRASIDARGADLVKAWDSGRVGRDELARATELIWGRLPDALGNPSAFSLAEACTLAAALYARLDAQLASDVLAGSGATDEITALRETLERCAISAGTLHRRTDDAAELSTRLDLLLDAGAQDAIAPGVAALTKAAYALEGLLIKEIALRAAVTRDAALAASTRTRLLAEEDNVRELAAEARLKIAAVPTLAIPSVATVGDPPPVPTAEVDAQPGTWTAARVALDGYLARLGRVEAALKEAADRYGSGLAQRADLRGLLGAYRDRAQRAGLAEDEALGAQYRAAHDVLFSAPCDIDIGEKLVGDYQRSVLAATQFSGVKEER